jgi:uncharacterized protein
MSTLMTATRTGAAQFRGVVSLLALLAAIAWACRPSMANSAEEEDARPANRLAKETSPYLLLHAHNPVNWYPWGDEALAKAKAEKKLIFLSIGFSTCHWCHVMERESFVDDEIADYLNEHFVSIKVDREERPEIDEIYMVALQALGRPGGWPLSMFLTPDAKPFFGGTYFPARDKQIDVPGTEGEKQAVTGFLTVLKLIAGHWEKSPDELTQTSDELSAHVKRLLARQALVPAEVESGVGDAVQVALTAEYDEKYGGFGYSPAQSNRPKFPNPSNLVFLLDRAQRLKDDDARRMLEQTLAAMAAGGIRDHVGGGFHRYSTDRRWRVPHFEKMLYDNAQLASLYAEAWQLTGRDDFREVAEEILAFVGRELTDESGGFYSAIDTESGGEEGAYYVWTRAEAQDALPPADYELFADAYGLTDEPNFKDAYVLLLPRPLAETAAQHQLMPAELEKRLTAARRALLVARGKRQRPLTDTKILAGWNGLMIRGFADAGRIFQDKRYVATAARAAEAVLEHLRDADGRLSHTFTAGQTSVNAYLDDYAFLADGLLALHQATDDDRWLQAADELTELQSKLFWDDRSSGFFFTSGDHEALFARIKDPVDSATPSGNAVAAANLAALARLRSKPAYLDMAEKTVSAFASYLNSSPATMPRMALSWEAVAGGRARAGAR